MSVASHVNLGMCSSDCLLWSLSFHSSGVSLILEPVCVFETVRIEWFKNLSPVGLMHCLYVSTAFYTFFNHFIYCRFTNANP